MKNNLAKGLLLGIGLISIVWVFFLISDASRDETKVPKATNSSWKLTAKDYNDLVIEVKWLRAKLTLLEEKACAGGYFNSIWKCCKPRNTCKWTVYHTFREPLYWITNGKELEDANALVDFINNSYDNYYWETKVFVNRYSFDYYPDQKFLNATKTIEVDHLVSFNPESAPQFLDCANTNGAGGLTLYDANWNEINAFPYYVYVLDGSRWWLQYSCAASDFDCGGEYFYNQKKLCVKKAWEAFDTHYCGSSDYSSRNNTCWNWCTLSSTYSCNSC